MWWGGQDWWRWSRNSLCLQDSYQGILESLSSRKYPSAHHHILTEKKHGRTEPLTPHVRSEDEFSCSVKTGYHFGIQNKFKNKDQGKQTNKLLLSLNFIINSATQLQKQNSKYFLICTVKEGVFPSYDGNIFRRMIKSTVFWIEFTKLIWNSVLCK